MGEHKSYHDGLNEWIQNCFVTWRMGLDVRSERFLH